MTVMGKFVAVVVSITMFVMPAATMPLHCILAVPSAGNTDHCHMMGMGSPAADQVNAQTSDHSCCQVSAARPESITVPRAPGNDGVVAPPMLVAFLPDLPATPVVRQLFDWNAQSPGGPPQAVLCTFLI